jgi:hypothetical protein
MKEKDIRKIVRKAISENFNQKPIDLYYIKEKKNEYDSPMEYYNDYFNNAIAELNVHFFPTLLDTESKIPESFNDSEGEEYTLINIKNKKGEGYDSQDKIEATYKVNIEGVNCVVFLEFIYQASLHHTNKLELIINNPTLEDFKFE